MNNKIKENVFNNFIEMIKKSWTYNRMTTEEKSKCINVLTSNRIIEDIKGTYIQRWNALNCVYYGFLIGIGYETFSWREKTESEVF